jgi:hypothetical protein
VLTEAKLECERLCIVIATIVINVVAVSLLTFAPWSDWRTGAALNIVDNCLLISFALVRRDTLLGRFLLFGLLVGFAELPADAWLVDYTRTLDYSVGGGPMIWRSPLWMPLAWEVVAVQFGYIGLRLWERFGKVGLLIIGLLGAINIPFLYDRVRSPFLFKKRERDIGFFASEPFNDARANAATATCDQSNFSRQAGDRTGFFVVLSGLIHGARPFLPWILLLRSRSVNDLRLRVPITLIPIEGTTV